MTTPRIAESLDDLRVGMVVALNESGKWSIEDVTQPHLWSFTFDRGHPVVILSDPPPEPVRVPADLIDAAVKERNRMDLSDWSPTGAVHALMKAVDAIDAARNGTDQ